MSGHRAKLLRKQADDIEVRGTAEWRKVYKLLKAKQKKGQYGTEG